MGLDYDGAAAAAPVRRRRRARCSWSRSRSGPTPSTRHPPLAARRPRTAPPAPAAPRGRATPRWCGPPCCADGSFEVVETVRLAAPVVQVRLAPPDLAPAGPAFAQAVPVWSDVVVEARDQEAVPVPRLDGGVTVPLEAPTTTVEVRYVSQRRRRAHGAVAGRPRARRARAARRGRRPRRRASRSRVMPCAP